MGQEYSRNVNVNSTVPSFADPILFDDLENLLVWIKNNAQNASAAVTQETTVAYSGAKSLKLDTGATNPASGDYVDAGRSAVVGTTRYVEFSSFFYLNPASSALKVQFYVVINSNGLYLPYAIQFNKATGILSYGSDFATFTQVPDSSTISLGLGWSFIKLVMDKVTGKYVTVQLNDKIFDLSGVTNLNNSTSTTSYIALDIIIYNTTATRQVAYFDNIRIIGKDNI